MQADGTPNGREATQLYHERQQSEQICEQDSRLCETDTLYPVQADVAAWCCMNTKVEESVLNLTANDLSTITRQVAHQMKISQLTL